MKNCLFPLLILTLIGCQQGPGVAPDPVLPIPTPQQLDWQKLEFYAFVHFNMNTFTDQEWGNGDESPELFNPTELDCGQWARVCKEAGMKGIILTAKHHDGFCLWPSIYTEHSVKNSPWKDGKGDVLKELAKACRDHGLKLGVYYSPWDRNHASYGTHEYLNYMRSQLGELLTNYGDIFEVWFDGANGGTGYYGGANEERRVDKKTYYDWKNTYPIIRKLQPNALIFSDAGPDVRWVGNERGYAFETMWSPLMRDSVYAGMIEYAEKYASGQENGTHWVPGETNVSIRPGWYYHENEDQKVKSESDLVDMYYKSIGRNTTWLLNFPVDTRGLIHENDEAQLKKLTAAIASDFRNELARNNKIEASKSRGSDFSADLVLDGDNKTYWAAPDGVIKSSLTIDFEEPTLFNRFLVQEYIALGQRVKTFNLEVETENGWEQIANATTIGYKRILRFPDVTSDKLRLNITDAKACPTISNIEIYYAPKVLLPPTISSNKDGAITISANDKVGSIFYTLDGTEPTINSEKYAEPFVLNNQSIIQAILIDEKTGAKSGLSKLEFDVSKTNWKVLSRDTNAIKIIDGLNQTWWENKSRKSKNEIVIDLGEKQSIVGFTYMPPQEQTSTGAIKEYEFYVSFENRIWTRVAKGEFGNIENSPTLQSIAFEEIEGRYVKLLANKTVDGKYPSYAEIGVLNKN